MSLGACLVGNEPPSLKDSLLQDRIKGLSWKEIADKHGLGSPGAARTMFKKLTGISDFKIKGKELKHIVDNDLLDDLKKAVPKAPKVPTQYADNASAQAAAVHTEAGAIHGSATKQIDVIYTESDAVQFWNKGKTLFPDNAAHAADQIKFNIGQSTYDGILADLKAGKYYSDIVNKWGVQFSDVDGIYWGETLKNLGDHNHAIWTAYKGKPTSEYGFAAVKDAVWQMKTAGATAEQIQSVTNIDKGVIDMILKDKWSLPDKGSKYYIGHPSAGYSSSASYANVAQELVGESAQFGNMSKSQVDNWIGQLGSDMTSQQVSYWSSYSGSFYTEVNSYLRSGGYGSPTSRGARAAADLKDSMRPIPERVTLHRGVGPEAFPGGPPSVGDAYSDPAFMSTSFGDRAAFGSKKYQMHIDVPEGGKARPIYNISGFGMSEREIVLDAGSNFIITGVQKIGNQIHVHMRMIP